MDVNLSFISDVNLKETLFLEEFEFEKIFLRVFDLIFYDQKVRALSNNKNLFSANPQQIELDVYFCDNKKIQELNNEYRRHDKPTDVLSFAMCESENFMALPIINLGEIIISVEKVQEQAKTNSHSLSAELIVLLSHGILHLLSVHHDTEVDYNQVIEIQKTILDKLKDFLE